MALPCIYSALQSNIVQLPFDSNELCMSFTDVSHVPGGSFGALFSYQSHLSRPTNARITRVYSFGLRAPSPSHVSSFGAVCLNNNHWNATLSHSEVSFKARHNPPPIPTLTFSHANMERSNFLLVAHFLGSFESIKNKKKTSFSSLSGQKSHSLKALRACLVLCVAISSLAVKFSIF